MHEAVAADRNHPGGSPFAGASGAAGKSIYFPTLDGLRFFAFLLVFVHHLPSSQNLVLRVVHHYGWVGVHLFLFLSAFLLTSILRKEYEQTGRISIFNFYVRRGLRIWPLYFGFCFAMLVLQILGRAETPVDWSRFLGLLFFVDNVLTGLQGYNEMPYVPHLWTISLEEQFYLLLPIILLNWLRDPPRLLWALFAIWMLFLGARILCVMLGAEHPLIWTSVFSADSLILGTALGAVRLPTIKSKSLLALLIVPGVVLLFSGVFLAPMRTLGWHQVLLYSLIALGAACIVLAGLLSPVYAFLGHQPLAYLGKISYGLYIFHLLGIALGEKLMVALGMSSWWWHAVLSLTCTLLLSIASYELFERHFLLLKRRFESVHSRQP
jgi:peptidoglycan/LPS O-acetylase OafA/YrhL